MDSKRFINNRRFNEEVQKYPKLSTFIQKSNFPESLLDLADAIFSQALDESLDLKFSEQAVIAASIYGAARIKELKISLEDLSKCSGESKAEICWASIYSLRYYYASIILRFFYLPC